ncbi:MAG TPA: hypothetical protein DEB57_13910, partial [Microbacterium sp.]|nr:hypothetical protein [Microbacterium sp.]
TELGGTETVGCTPVLSPHADMGDPIWFAVNESIPEFGTEMTLVLSVVDEQKEAEAVRESDAE